MVSVRDPSVPRSPTLVSVGDPGVLLCSLLTRPAPRRSRDPRRGPGGRTPRRGKEGTRRSHALGKFPRAQPGPQVPASGILAAHTARGALGRVRATHARTPPPQSPGRATPSPRSQGQGKVGNPGPAGGGEKPARCPHCLAPAAGREGAHLRSPPGALAGRAARQ